VTTHLQVDAEQSWHNGRPGKWSGIASVGSTVASPAEQSADGSEQDSNISPAESRPVRPHTVGVSVSKALTPARAASTTAATLWTSDGPAARQHIAQEAAFAVRCRRCGMSEAAVQAWLQLTPTPWLYLPAGVAAMTCSAVALAVTYLYGSRMFAQPRKAVTQTDGALAAFTVAMSVVSQLHVGPDDVERRPVLGACFWLLNLTTIVALDLASALAPLECIPFNDRFLFLLCTGVVKMTSMTGGILALAPWARRLRTERLWTPLWKASLSTLEVIDGLSDIMYVRFVYDKVRFSAGCASGSCARLYE
jgi:hypothetical protein